MGTTSAVALAAISLTKNTKIGLAIVAVVVVLLLIAMLVLARRRRAQKKAPAQPGTAPAPEMPQPTAAIPATLTENGAGPVGVTAAPVDDMGTTWSAPAPASPPPPPPSPLGGTPPPGTPAGWLPAPDGTPDTLRYWDGFAWTQHVAQRT